MIEPVFDHIACLSMNLSPVENVYTLLRGIEGSRPLYDSHPIVVYSRNAEARAREFPGSYRRPAS